MSSIPLCIRFDKLDGFIKTSDGIRYLVLFIYLYDKICNRIKYLLNEKSGIADSFNYKFTKIRIASYNSLPIKKILTFHNVIILINSNVNEKKNKYYYNIFLETGSYKDKSDTRYIYMNNCIL